MAGSRPLRRHERLRKGQPAQHLEVSRLGDRRAQPRHAVRPVHDRADRRRHAARGQRPAADPGSEDRDRVPPQRDDERRRRCRSRRVDVRNARGSREHDRNRVARQHHRLRPVPQPQVRSLQPEGLLPAARASSPTRTTRAVRSATAHGTSKPGSISRPRSRRRRASARRPSSTGSSRSSRRSRRTLRAAQDLWEQSLRAAERAWIPLTPAHANATNGVHADRAPRPLAPGVGPEPGAHVVRDHGRHHGAGDHRACVSKRCPTARCRGTARGGTRTGTSVSPAFTSRSRRSRPRPAHVEQAVQFTTIKVDDSAYPFEPADLLSAGRGPASRKGGSWAINAMRDSERVPRHAVLAAQTPFGFPGGTRITVRIDHLDGTIGQGIGRLRLSATTAPDPLVGSDLAARLRPDPGATGERAQPGAGRRAGRVLPLDRAVAAARARRADGSAQGTRRPPDSLHARHEGAALVRAAVVRVARARQLHGQGRARLRAHARRPSIRCATTCP